jgi:hypothetical protein
MSIVAAAVVVVVVNAEFVEVSGVMLYKIDVEDLL